MPFVESLWKKNTRTEFSSLNILPIGNVSTRTQNFTSVKTSTSLMGLKLSLEGHAKDVNFSC